MVVFFKAGEVVYGNIYIEFSVCTGEMFDKRLSFLFFKDKFSSVYVVGISGGVG